MLADVGGLGYAVLFLLISVPGLPLGFALFGPRHLGGWVAGLLLGYAATTLSWWAIVYTGHVSTLAFAAAWALAGGVSWVLVRPIKAPLVALPAWTARDTTAMVLLLLLVPALMARPLERLGSQDADGNRQYRAYFIADFVWHTALTAELAKHEPRPRNPFLAHEPVHYYWTYFRVPATIAAETDLDVQTVLKLNAVATALLLLMSIYLAAWTACPDWPLTTALAVALTVVAPSIEGLAGMADVIRRGLPLSELRDLNIDAIAAWAFKGLRIDNLPRTMWYTPQHAFSCALGLLAVPVALASGVRARPAAILLAGCALGASLAFNPLLGVAFCAVYGFAVLMDMWATQSTIRDLLRHALAVVPVAAALAWCSLNQVGDGAGTAIHFGFSGLARNATLVSFLLQFGPILLPMAIALWPGNADSWRRAWPAIAGVTIAVLVMHLVSLTVDPAWVGFRSGNIFFVLAPALVARGFIRLWRDDHRAAALGLAVMVMATGLPTTIIDAYNTQDVTNRHLSRDAERVRGGDVAFDRDLEFHWTVLITAREFEALDWIRVHTPADAVVQHEPTVRGRETWSLIPTWAERRMATGDALPLLPVPEYAEKNALVKEIYAGNDPRRAWEQAKALGIDYLYVDATERAAYPAVDKFDNYAEFFTPVFKNAEASVYALRP